MNTARRIVFLFFSVFGFTAVLHAQKEAPAPPPQTPRQALIELVSGGQPGVMKHLTVEVQELLAKPENSPAMAAVGMYGSMKSGAGPDFQMFETGPVLFSFTDRNQQNKYEIRVDNDDLSGDQDTLEVSIHTLRDGQEIQEEWSYLISQITVNMVRQQGIWRLNKIGVGAEFPLGDAEFLKKMFLESKDAGMVGGKIGPPEEHTGIPMIADSPEKNAELSASVAVVLLGQAEREFASQHADVGFTCSLQELDRAAKGMGLNQQIANGTYGGYKLNLTGCLGKPAGSFQITLEPNSPGNGGKAFCVDATQNVRVSDDGRAATCLASGRPENNKGDQGEAVGWDPISAGSPAKPKQ